MKSFTCRHEVHVSAPGFWEHVHFGNFNQALYGELLGYDYEVLEDDRESGRRRTHIVPVVDAPAILRKAFGDRTAFHEEGQFLREPEPKYRFKVIPAVFSKKISIEGSMVAEPIDAQRCYRVVSFEIDCKVFGIGKVFEHFVSSEIQSNYVRSAAFTNEFLAKRLGAPQTAASGA